MTETFFDSREQFVRMKLEGKIHTYNEPYYYSKLSRIKIIKELMDIGGGRVVGFDEDKYGEWFEETLEPKSYVTAKCYNFKTQAKNIARDYLAAMKNNSQPVYGN